ncbi:mitochondrial ribosomal subunit protein-domain-containing protein [Halteromyces radiatus]|uniref:mitochondrial ribosomal subunit protein-domain-containing protein n=1 Tax=Halteromyces radiatus TaxID=101107 RepID=UPI0022202952|nr:mitochondrial ribosomal subunit protein-domain-containing protein [Halteromyces radiatus]KAI8099303.1 mitochondrial ribosomal subunit protein-domain-containing protein [Halteromyces radiatus]
MLLSNIVRSSPTTCNIRLFSATSTALVGRQTGRFRKPEKKFDVDHMEPFAFDDQTTIGHNLFENIRHVRQYLRKTKYELPKLGGFAQPFVPPTADQIVQYKTHTYCGEGHPVERKVVLSVKVTDLKLTPSQRHKLLLLAGPRYHVDTDELIMSSEKFPQVKQNKKYVTDILNTLLKEAKDDKDTFADIPLNLPQPKKKLVFPKEWARPPQQQQSQNDQLE